MTGVMNIPMICIDTLCEEGGQGRFTNDAFRRLIDSVRELKPQPPGRMGSSLLKVVERTLSPGHDVADKELIEELSARADIREEPVGEPPAPDMFEPL